MTIVHNMWKTTPATMLAIVQTTNLVTILGIATGPQIARPLLGHKVYRVPPLAVLPPLGPAAPLNASTPADDDDDDEGGLAATQKIYLLAGTLNVIMAVVCLLTFLFECATSGDGLRTVLRDPDADDAQPIAGGADPSAADLDKLEPCSWTGCVLLTIVVVFAVVSGGYAVVLSGLLFTYLYEYLGWPTDISTVLVTAKDVMRFVSTAVLTFLVSAWMSPTRQMAFNVVALLAASVLMSSALLSDASTVGLTVTGAVVAGLGSYNMCSTIIALVDQTVQVEWRFS